MAQWTTLNSEVQQALRDLERARDRLTQHSRKAVNKWPELDGFSIQSGVTQASARAPSDPTDIPSDPVVDRPSLLARVRGVVPGMRSSRSFLSEKGASPRPSPRASPQSG